MTSPYTRVGACTADASLRTADDVLADPLAEALVAMTGGMSAAMKQAVRGAMTEERTGAPQFDTPVGTGSPGVTDTELRALTLLTNRTSSRTSASGGPALPMRDGVRVYLEGLSEDAAAAYARPVAELAEAEVAVLRVAAAGAADGAAGGVGEDDTDRVLDIAASVPTVVVLRAVGPCPAPEFTDNCAALLVDLGAPDRTVLDVVFGRHAPLGRLPFPVGAAQDPEFPEGFGLAY
jgi:beta-glucosidase